jgi:hypothetical protein
MKQAWGIQTSRNHQKVKKALARLGEPRTIWYDVTLISRIQNARYTWSNYCDAHWIMQVEAQYRSSAAIKGQTDPKAESFNKIANLTAAACEMILQIALRAGPTAAKKEAKAVAIFGIPAWVLFDDDDARWLEVRLDMQKRMHATRDGD